jgi:hypothetical protein
MTEKREKRYRIIVKDPADSARALNLVVFDTDIDRLIVEGKRIKIFCADKRDVYEKMKKVLEENNIKFSVEE